MNKQQRGRAVMRVYLHARSYAPSRATSVVGSALKTGRAMDLAARLRRRGEGLTSTEVLAFAGLIGLDQADLVMWALPLLHENGVVTADIRDGEIRRVDEFVGVAAPFLEQVATVWSAASSVQEAGEVRDERFPLGLAEPSPAETPKRRRSR